MRNSTKYYSVIKLGRVIWAGHGAYIGDRRGAIQGFGGEV
jgi:hypothetical protein